MNSNPNFKTSARRLVPAFIFLLSMMCLITDAQATSSILSANNVNGATDCSSCHAGAQNSSTGRVGMAKLCVAAGKTFNLSTLSCITAPVGPTVSCNSPLVRDAATNTCVNPTSTVSSGSCNKALSNDDDEDDDEHVPAPVEIVPTLSAPNKVSINAGGTLKVAFTALDCSGRQLSIVPVKLPTGATIVNSIDTELHLAKAIVTWTVPATTKPQKLSITLKAIATESTNKTASSAPQTVLVKVLPAVQSKFNVSDALVDANVLASASFNAATKKLDVSGQVIWSKTSTAQQRQAILKETAMITDSTNGAYLGTAIVNINGNWKAPVAIAFGTCSVNVTFHGKTDVRDVTGVKNCPN